MAIVSRHSWKGSGSGPEHHQQWVSACLVARTNESGDELEIFVEGDDLMLGFGTDPAFPMYEGAFFGNVFTDPVSKHACRGSAEGVAAAEQQGRSCTLSSDECGFTTFADCMTDAGCEAGPSGGIIDCRPDPAGPSYHATVATPRALRVPLRRRCESVRPLVRGPLGGSPRPKLTLAAPC